MWTAADHDVLDDIMSSSSAELDSWLPGCRSAVADFDAYLDRVVRSADDGTGWYYGIEAAGLVVGQCTIHPNGDGTAEIGYWIRSDRANEGIATRAVRALCRAAADDGFATLLIHCDEGNVRSAAVARKAGFTHLATVDLDPSLERTDAQTGREMTWRLALESRRRAAHPHRSRRTRLR